MNVRMVIQELIVKHVCCKRSFEDRMYEMISFSVTGLVPEELLPLLLKEAAAENAEEGKIEESA